MTVADHNKFLGIGFAAFAAIFFFTFLLLALVSVGVFVALGITMANETGDANQAGFGILGAIFTVIFYGVLGLICVLPPALASWKMLKRKPGARLWGIIAAIVVNPPSRLGVSRALTSSVGHCQLITWTEAGKRLRSSSPAALGIPEPVWLKADTLQPRRAAASISARGR